MADELPEKVKAAIEKGPICVAIGEQALGVETYAMFARRIARLAIEESTRSLRERLERAASGPMKDSTGTWTERICFDSDCIVNGVEVKAGTSWGPFEKSRNIRRSDALAIREEKDSAHD